MIKNEVAEAGITEHPAEQTKPPLAVIACTCAFILCILISIAPLSRLAGIATHIPFSARIMSVGAWLPGDLGLNKDPQTSRQITSDGEFLLLMVLAFAAYLLCALYIWRQTTQSSYKRVSSLIWLGAVLAGGIFLLTQALLSRDIFSYDNYGRLLVVYHANPFFVPPAAYPRDPLYLYNNWPKTIAVYGPLSLVIFSALAQVAGSNILLCLLSFRLFGLGAHLANTFLVITILRTKGCSPRTVALGTLLYAWNPLVLLESSLSGHIDVLMVTFLLLGIVLCVRLEQQGVVSLRSYLLPLVIFTLAALVRYTAAPLIGLLIVVLARNAFYVVPLAPTISLRRWRPALLTVLLAGTVCGLVLAVGYAPFWLGHNIREIVSSFTAQPSSNFAENSILRVVFDWSQTHPLPAHTLTHTLVYLFSQHSTWTFINLVIVAVAFVVGVVWVWCIPTIRTITLATLAILGALLLVTPWFYPWYLTWLVGLAVVCLPITQGRVERALLAFALAFSASAFVAYAVPIFDWLRLRGFEELVSFGLPLLAFLIFLLHWPSISNWFTRLPRMSRLRTSSQPTG